MNLPRIAELEFNTEEMPSTLQPIGKTYLYDLDKGDFVTRNGKLVELRGIEALKMWIRKVLKTERFRFKIYEGEEYGVTLEDLIGSSLPRSFVESEIEREVTTSLLRHTHIESIRDWTFERDGKWMRVNFTVITVEGAFDMEVSV